MAWYKKEITIMLDMLRQMQDKQGRKKIDSYANRSYLNSSFIQKKWI